MNHHIRQNFLAILAQAQQEPSLNAQAQGTVMELLNKPIEVWEPAEFAWVALLAKDILAHNLNRWVQL